ncbi:FxsA family protein [Kitasatospora sp. NBC_01250]|uniref:FxsA family membrane protein n=1 Tax=unclassified Kitasatospora TaxID=2633591 RepID=UPI002E0F1A56|nr:MULTISPECIES: FxsA family membrane protein [unclassified Kitasatospora]WSJ65882.1 FxsA family protein [Kitasatospora sp. NBC_01302]
MTQHVDPTRVPGQPGAPSRRRGRLRRVLPLLVAAWLVLEIWLVIQVASVTGWLAVLLLLLLGVVVGGRLIKRAGLKALRAASASFEQGAVPPSGAAETGTSLTVLAGLLLILPGFLSDLIGLTLLFPPTRSLWRLAGRRAAVRVLRTPGGGDPLADALRLQEQMRIHRPDGKIVQGEVVDPADHQGGAGSAWRPGEDDQRPPLGR